MGNKHERMQSIGNERLNGNRTVGPSHRVIAPDAMKAPVIFNVVDAHGLAAELRGIHQQAREVRNPLRRSRP